MQVVTALIHLSGELQFIDNSGGEKSALHMQSFSQAVLNKGLSIMFEGNSGRLDINISGMHIYIYIYISFAML